MYYFPAILLLATVVPHAAAHEPAAQAAFHHDAIRVPVELGVMSRCPDALLCEALFDKVLKKVGEKVDLRLVYVAELNSTDSEFGITCLHGPGECAGNVQQLCAAKYSSQWWNFIQCQNSEGRFQVGVPDVVLRCAKAVGIDWETSAVGRCAGLDVSGKTTEGLQLFRESILLGKTLGIEKSCTVLINHRKVCVHDGTWKECEDGHTVDDFVKQIDHEYERINSHERINGDK
ncbi:hypothetical protein C8J57DRAFT_1432707 [Mycena rebaudengoi]|nr:hypothetical protein C8J57DRAFT_1432707 [Mycena rebaudengoi]